MQRILATSRHFYAEDDTVMEQSTLDEMKKIVARVCHSEREGEMSSLLVTAWTNQVEQRNRHDFSLDASRIHILSLLGNPSSSRVISGIIVSTHHLNDIYFANTHKSWRGLMISGSIKHDYNHRGYNESIKSKLVFTLPAHTIQNKSTDWIDCVVQKLKAMQINLLLVQGSVDDKLLDECFSSKILVITNINEKLLRNLSVSLSISMENYILDCDESNVISDVSIERWTMDDIISRDNYILIKIPQQIQTLIICSNCTPLACAKEHCVRHLIHRLSASLTSAIDGNGKVEDECISWLRTKHKEPSLLIDAFQHFVTILRENCNLSDFRHDVVDAFRPKTEAWISALLVATTLVTTDAIVLVGDQNALWECIEHYGTSTNHKSTGIFDKMAADNSNIQRWYSKHYFYLLLQSRYRKSNFIDKLRIHVKGGIGGKGSQIDCRCWVCRLPLFNRDLPGLIEGAHYNVGMGHRFLKHVERTKLLLFVVDVNGFQLGNKYPFRSAFETIVLLNKELELYKEELLDKQAVLVINKMDTETADKNFDLLMNNDVYFHSEAKVIARVKMVLKTSILNAAFKYTEQGRRLIDKLRIHVKAGAGGMGNPRFEGVGGKGGDVYVVANHDQTLLNLSQEFPKQRFSASVGEDSKARYVMGAPGNDLKIKVPVGVQVLTDQGRLLGDLKKEDSSVLVAQGGGGGCAENQYSGQRGQAQTILLDLKLISDVGFVGFPLAGKSTIVRSIANQAKTDSKIRTSKTIESSIHTAEYSDYRKITLADIPSIVEGAHENSELGHNHLKHIERAKLLVFVVDIHGFQLSNCPFREAFETIIILNKQLELYNEELVKKPTILVVNKMDRKLSTVKLQILMDKLKHSPDALKELPQHLAPTNVIKFDAVISLSALNREEIDELKNRLRHFLDINAEIKELSQGLIRN
uniref:OBG-type G domain-containing protein n=1 Tax=Strigamia maritima TaxID=126957 RepID=T1JAB0_STRMM